MKNEFETEFLEDCIDWSIYGSLVRLERFKSGFRNVEKLSDAIYRRTRITIGKNTIYSIEQGRQKPSTTQFLAINATLFNDPMPKVLKDACLTKEYRNYCEIGSLPIEWKEDNYFDACANLMNLGVLRRNEFPSVEEIAVLYGEDPAIFARDDELILDIVSNSKTSEQEQKSGEE